MRILVTGATGFVGRHLVAHWAGRHELVCLVRAREEALLEVGRGRIVEADLAQSLACQGVRLRERVDAVVHLAQARVPFPESAMEFFAATTASTMELLDYGRRVGIKAFVYASSGSVYGAGPHPFREDSPLRLEGFYPVNKRCSELLVESYGKFFCTHILRLFFPYGPGQRGRRIAMIAERVVRGQAVDVVEHGRPRINPIYVDDVVRIIDRALSVEGKHIVNVAGDEVVSMVDLAKIVGEIVGRRPVFNHGQDQVLSDLIGDNQLMHRLYGVAEGELTPLREGLREVVDELRLREVS